MPGLERFREHFHGLESSYVLIGGTAAHLLLDEAGLAFWARRSSRSTVRAMATTSVYTRALAPRLTSAHQRPIPELMPVIGRQFDCRWVYFPNCQCLPARSAHGI